MKYSPLVLFFLLSCSPTTPTEVVEPTPLPKEPSISKKDSQPEGKLDAPEENGDEKFFAQIKGDYLGEFVAEKFKKKKSPTMKNKIKFSLKKLDSQNKQLFGSSIVAGGERSFSGPYSLKYGILSATLSEPGDNKYDGIFKVSIKSDEKHLQGSWVANDKNLAVSERSFKLDKATFKYNPNAKVTYQSFMKHLLKYRGESPNQIEKSHYETEDLNASVKKLTNKDVENLISEDLALMRNAIYARHGYAFKTRKYRYYFEREVDWYVPFSTDVRAELSELEKANIKLIKRYEKHAAEYYDTFGR